MEAPATPDQKHGTSSGFAGGEDWVLFTPEAADEEERGNLRGRGLS